MSASLTKYVDFHNMPGNYPKMSVLSTFISSAIYLCEYYKPDDINCKSQYICKFLYYSKNKLGHIRGINIRKMFYKHPSSNEWTCKDHSQWITMDDLSNERIIFYNIGDYGQQITRKTPPKHVENEINTFFTILFNSLYKNHKVADGIDKIIFSYYNIAM